MPRPLNLSLPLLCWLPLLAACDLLPLDRADAGEPDAGDDAGVVVSEPRTIPLPMTLVQSENRSFSAVETVGTRVLATRRGQLVGSDDRGTTWNALATESAGSLVARGGSRVFASFGRTSLRVSDDAGDHWTEVVLPETEGSWRSPFAALGADGDVWVLAYETASDATERQVLLRESTSGFERVPLPEGDSAEGDWRLSAATGGVVAVAWSDWTGLSTESVWVRGGGEWTRAASFTGVTELHYTDEGALLVGVRGGGATVRRTDDGGATWTEDVAAGANPRFRRGLDGKVWRVTGGTGEGSRIESSVDDGRTWGFETSLFGYVTDLSELPGAVVAMESGEPAWRRGGTGPFQSDKLPGFASTFVDVAFAGDRVVALHRKVGSPTELFVSDDAGKTWAPGPTDARRTQCVCLSPDGTRVLVGLADFGTGQGYVRLGALAEPASIVDTTVRTVVSGAFPYGVRQCTWYRDAHGGEVVVLAMANDAGLEGALVWSPVIDGRPVQWSQRYTRTEGMPGDTRPRMAYFGLALTRDARGAESLDVGVFQYLGGHVTNGTHLWLWSPESLWDETWFKTEVPPDIGWRPITLSPTTPAGDAMVALYEGRVGAGPPLRLAQRYGPQHVLVPTHPSFGPQVPLHAAKVAPDGHLWLGTDHGLYRSDATVASLMGE